MRYVYVLKSGTLHPTTKTYWLTPRYYSSRKLAEREFKQVLEVNQAESIEDTVFNVCDDTLKSVDYIGEQGKYKARLILERQILN
jgi:hypothetical protein